MINREFRITKKKSRKQSLTGKLDFFPSQIITELSSGNWYIDLAEINFRVSAEVSRLIDSFIHPFAPYFVICSFYRHTCTR